MGKCQGVFQEGTTERGMFTYKERWFRFVKYKYDYFKNSNRFAVEDMSP